MNRSTTILRNRIAIIFDFDETLAPKTDRVLMKHLGVDPDVFAKENIEPLKAQGYENVLAKAWAMIQFSNNKHAITKDLFKKIGNDYPLYSGVKDLFPRLRQIAEELVEDIEVEFHLITAGFKEIPSTTTIAEEFTEIWGGEYEYDDDDKIIFVKNIVTHPEKVRYVMMIAKGLNEKGANGPEDIWMPIPREDWHIPLDQIIYLGDGNSDLQIFGYLYRNRGIGIGVMQEKDPTKWPAHEDMHSARAVENLAYANYEKGSELFKSLELSITSICNKINLRKLGN